MQQGYPTFIKTSKQLQILEGLDNKFVSFLAGNNFKSIASPSLISEGLLREYGYFESFPHYLNCLCRLNPSKAQRQCDKISNIALTITGQYLLPAACLHVYPMFRNRARISNNIITLKPTVYRFEEKVINHTTRRWEFQVREIVIIGSQHFVRKCLIDLARKSLVYAQTIDNRAKLLYATDHFFHSEANNNKMRLQKLGRYKQELTMQVNGEHISLASFNFHGTHFSKSLGFDCKGKVVTGCVGFGMERWLHALECKHKRPQSTTEPKSPKIKKNTK